jgi:plasmid maintenance system killer protein
MIVGFRDKRTRDFVTCKRVKTSMGIERAAHLNLDCLEAAVELKTLWLYPATVLKR